MMNLYNPNFGTNDGAEERVKNWLKIHLCPDDCEFLNPTEASQEDKRERHFCTKHDQQVFHGYFHPKIIAVKNCKYTTKGVKK